MCVDYSLRSYEDWLQFAIFSTDEDHESIEISPLKPLLLVEYFGRACVEMKDLSQHYSYGQLDRLIWRGLSHPFWIAHIVTDPNLPIEPREKCIEQMYQPYVDVVAKIPESVVMENGFDMWWDIVCGGFCMQHSYFDDAPFVPVNIESRRIHDKLLETLERILRIPEPRTQSCALHGLGHIHHPKSAGIVQRFIDKHRDECDERGLKWL